MSAERRYRTLPVRPKRELPHDDECPCTVCMQEFRARRVAASRHKKTIICQKCGAYITVSVRRALTASRERAIERHYQQFHALSLVEGGSNG